MFSEGPIYAFLLHHEKIEIIAGFSGCNAKPPRIDEVRTFFKNRNLPARFSPGSNNPD